VRHRSTAALPPRADDLEELQIVTKREYRRGYPQQVDGRLTRLKYRKLMTTPDGQLVVCRPPAGEERFKITPSEFGKAFGVFLLMIWPITCIALIASVGFLIAALR
jgi:nitrate reductase NapE component